LGLKKFFIFSLSFILANVILQVFSGMILTMLYTPSVEWTGLSSLLSGVEFGGSSFILSLITALIAVGIAHGVTKLSLKK
jgi:quinol-cytochrome oxidoreductase complex cytochrome b subunit